MSLPLITRHKPDLSAWSLALETERALGYGRPLKGEPSLDEERTLDEEQALDRERTLSEPTDLTPVGDLIRGASLDASTQELLLTTNYPHMCSRCHRYVHSEFVEIRVDRKVWVFCGKPCRLKWDAEHLPVSKVGS